MSRKNFTNVDIYAGINSGNGQQWQKNNNITANWRTPEQIDIQPVYTKEDWKAWSTSILQQVFLRSSAAPTP
jgi:hypothetical protein